MTYLANAAESTRGKPRPDLRTPARNRWFTSKLLDAYHMQLETDYFNHKRWLINRLVVGSGVVAGLDVLAGPDTGDAPAVIITPGLAIDWHGREIIVPKKTEPIKIPRKVLEEAETHAPAPGDPASESAAAGAPPTAPKEAKPHLLHIQVLLCYCTCDGEPVPIEPGNDCQYRQCVPGATFEKFEVRFHPRPAPKLECRCDLPSFVVNNQIDHAALARWITRSRPLEPHRDPCVVLANIAVRRTKSGSNTIYYTCKNDDIDIYARHVVYSYDLLFHLIAQVCEENGPQHMK